MATYLADVAGVLEPGANGRYKYEPVKPDGSPSPLGSGDHYYYKPNRNYFVRYVAGGYALFTPNRLAMAEASSDILSANVRRVWMKPPSQGASATFTIVPLYASGWNLAVSGASSLDGEYAQLNGAKATVYYSTTKNAYVTCDWADNVFTGVSIPDPVSGIEFKHYFGPCVVDRATPGKITVTCGFGYGKLVLTDPSKVVAPVQTVAQGSCDWSAAGMDYNKLAAGACRTDYEGKQIPNQGGCYFNCATGYELRDREMLETGQLDPLGHLSCDNGKLVQKGSCVKPGASCALTAPADVDVGLSECNYDTGLADGLSCLFKCKPGLEVRGGLDSYPQRGQSSCDNGTVSTVGRCAAPTTCAFPKPPANMHAGSDCAKKSTFTFLSAPLADTDGCYFGCAAGYEMVDGTLAPSNALQAGQVKCNSGTLATVGSCVATQTVQQCDLNAAGFAMPKNMLPASECNVLYAAKTKVPGGSMCTFTCDTGYNISGTDDQVLGTISCANQKLTTKGTCVAFAAQTGLEPQGAGTGTPVPKPQDTGTPLPLPTPTTLTCASFAFTPPCPAVGAAIVSTLKVDLPGATHIVPMSVAEGGWLGFAQTGLIVFASGGHIKYAVAKAAFTDAKVTLSDTSLVYAFTAGTADAWVTVQSGVDPFVAKGFSLMWILILCGLGLLILMALGYAGYKSTQTE